MHVFIIFHNDAAERLNVRMEGLRAHDLDGLDATLQRKSHLCIPFLGIARPQPQFPHSCVCERFIYSQPGSVYIFPPAE
jgi:hypothetical protein